ncbi:MAG: trigger factor [Lachnospiraceae bacterium]|nr:trigger factor [Lachnospiraceae bacterium]
MKVQVESQEKNIATLRIELDAAVVDKAIKQAYNKQKNSISIPGFRKGKVPQAMIEKMYGPSIFYEEAANIMIRENYPDAYDECELDIVSSPQVDIVQIEKGQPFIFTAVVATKPEVKLGAYEGIEVTDIDVSVSSEEIDEEINKELKNNSRLVDVTDRPIEQGDTANIDFTGYMDDEPFEGGDGKKFDLEIGSHSFIDNFEDQLVGKNIGDDVDVNVTFPEDYQASNLAGKPAVFKVHINGIKGRELPVLDDDFVGDVSEEAETVDEYKAEIEKKLKEKKEAEARQRQEAEIITKIVEGCEMDIPEQMIDSQVNTMINDTARSMAQSGLSFEQYLGFTGMTIDQMREQMRPDAVDTIKNSLTLEAIAKEQDIKVTDEDIDARIDEMAARYYMSGDDLRKNVDEDGRKQISVELSVKKAMDYVLDHAKKVKEDK